MSRDALDSLIEQFDIERYCIERGADEVAQGEFLLDCPECGKRKLTVNAAKKAWHCWYCEGRPGLTGRGGLIQLIKHLDQVTVSEAVNKIKLGGRYAGQSTEKINASLVYDSLTDRPPLPISAPENSRPIDGILPYMAQRGLTLEDVRTFGLWWCDGGRYAQRLIFPVWENGHFVYFQARAMWEAHQQPYGDFVKAMNPTRSEGHAVSSDVLMNLDQARLFPRVAVVEGPMDCVRTGPSAVCTFGKKISSRQVAKLVRAGVRAIDLMWDGPSAKEPLGAFPEMLQAAPTLAQFFEVRIVRLPFGDPGSKSRAELDWYRERAEPFDRFSALAMVT